MANSNGYEYYGVMEEAPTGREQKFEIIREGPKADGDNGVNFIEWRQTLLTFNTYNYNRRKWNAPFMRQSMVHPLVKNYFDNMGGLPGENNHPTVLVDGQKISIERLGQIDANNISLLLKTYGFEGDNRMWGVFQTIDDGNGPGDKLRRSILQGMVPSVSIRSLVPQRKNANGTTDVVGPGRVICWDRVFYPSDVNASANPSVPFKAKSMNVVKTSFKAGNESINVEIPMTELVGKAIEDSNAAKYVLDGLEYAMESTVVTRDGMIASDTNEGTIFIPLEEKAKDSIRNFMRNWG